MNTQSLYYALLAVVIASIGYQGWIQAQVPVQNRKKQGQGSLSYRSRLVLIVLALLPPAIFVFFVLFDVEDGSLVRANVSAQWREIWDPPRTVTQELDIFDKWALRMQSTMECYFWDKTVCTADSPPWHSDNSPSVKPSRSRGGIRLLAPMARGLQWWRRRVHVKIAEWRPIKRAGERMRRSLKTLLTPIRKLRAAQSAFREWLNNVRNVSEGAGTLGSLIQSCKDFLDRPKVKVLRKALVRLIIPLAAAARILSLLF